MFDEAYKEAWYEDKPPGYLEHRQNWFPEGKIGKWILTKNAELKIGGTLFVHGGISPGFADWSIEDINFSVRESLINLDEREGSILCREDGPLWYRGLALPCMRKSWKKSTSERR